MALRNLARHRRNGRYIPSYTLGGVASIGGGSLDYSVDDLTGRVSVFGLVQDVDPTAAAEESFELSLPPSLPMAIAEAGDVNGQAESSNGETGLISGSVANGTAVVTITYVATGAQDVIVRFEYTPGV